LLVAPTADGNLVVYALDGRYKILNLEAAVTGAVSAGNSTSIQLNIDGKPVLLSGATNVQNFFPGVTPAKEWVINVSGVRQLQLTVRGTPDTPLLVSGSLTG
jgi:hypothetical protein